MSHAHPPAEISLNNHALRYGLWGSLSPLLTGQPPTPILLPRLSEQLSNSHIYIPVRKIHIRKTEKCLISYLFFCYLGF